MLLIFLITSVITFCNCEYPDFYWRPYNGIIPPDAIIGATNDRTPVYIGAGPVPHCGSIVGQINLGFRNMTVTTLPTPDGRYTYDITKYINIMCTQHPDKFHWVDSKRGQNFEKVPGKFIVGGYEYSSLYPNPYPLHVTRIKRDGVFIIGKSCPWPTEYGNAYYNYQGAEVRVPDEDEYQTLVYGNHRGNQPNRDDTVYEPRSDSVLALDLRSGDSEVKESIH